MALTRTNHSGEKPLIKNPAIIVVNFLLIGIVVLFLSFSYGYFAFKNEKWLDFRLPRVFWISAMLVVAISVVMRNMIKYYDADKHIKLRRNILVALVLAIGFVICQFIGWQNMQQQGMLIDTTTGASYVYLLTGLHAIHILVGIIFLSVATYRIFHNTRNQVNALIYFSDPLHRSRIKMMATYWHTIDALWIYLFLAFLYNHT
jgi:cytochrome c oxidase subunit 3